VTSERAPEAASRAALRAEIRRGRVRSFLRVHLVLCSLGLLGAVVEAAQGVQNDPLQVWVTWGSSLVPTLYTLIAFQLFRVGRVVDLLIPAILALDSVVVLAALFANGEAETPGVALPILLLVMLPLFSDRGRLVYGLAGLQVGLFITLLYLRHVGVVPHGVTFSDPTHDPSDFMVIQGIAFTVVVLGAAFLAGRTSVDVLNSQARLEREITEATRALREAQARLVQQEKMAGLGVLTAGVVHEVNNPLTFVRTNISTLERDIGDVLEYLEAWRNHPDLQAKVPEIVAEMEQRGFDYGYDEALPELLRGLLTDAREGIDRVEAIVQDLKRFTRLDEADRKSVDLGADLGRALKLIRHKCDDRIEFVEDYEEMGLVEVHSALLNQVFVNLIENAIDAVGDDGGTIRISTRATGEDILIEVADTGPGVPPELRQKVFDPFFTTKEVGKGMGLGLSLSYQIVDKHGGTLTVGDAPEGGALFSLRIPRHEATEAVAS
jgi:signal transduction histidine kinase